MATLPFSQFLVKDKAAGNLVAAITSGASSFSLSAGHGAFFPASDFVAKIGDEDIHVATRTTDAFAGCTRGYNSTVAAAHALGDRVFLPAGASLFQRIYDNLAGHTHAQSEVASLVSDLAGKAASGHTHAGVYEPANANIQSHVASAHAPANAQANADITKAEIEAKLTGVISSHSHSGGSDPWTVVALAADFATSSGTAVDVTGLAFTPAANLRYRFEAVLMTRTATTTVGPRPGLAWATGLSDGVAVIKQTSSATAELTTNGNISAALLCAVGGVPTTTGSWPASISGIAVAGASPSGTVRVQLASETAGTNVTAKAGSFLRYRTY